MVQQFRKFKFFMEEHKLSTKSDDIKNILDVMVKKDWVKIEDHGAGTNIYILIVMF